MSLHKKPLTDLERTGLELHHLPIGKPSQLSDCFRNGIAWAEEVHEYKLKTTEEENKNLINQIAILKAELSRYTGNN